MNEQYPVLGINELAILGFDEACNVILVIERTLRDSFYEWDADTVAMFEQLFIDNLNALGFNIVANALITTGFTEPDEDAFLDNLAQARNILLDAVADLQ